MKKHLVTAFVILLSAGLYAATLRGVPGRLPVSEIKGKFDQATQPLELSPERGRYAHVVSLAETGRYELTQQWADVVYPDVGYYGGRFYSYFAPGISYLVLPFFLAGRYFGFEQVATYGFVSLVSLLALLFLYRIARDVLRVPRWVALSAVLVFAFGSTAWSYAVTLYQHHVTAFLILSGFYAVWRYRQRGSGSWLWGLWVWLAYGLAMSIDYPNAVLMLPVMVYFLIVSVTVDRAPGKLLLGLRPAILLTSVAFLFISGLHGYHNYRHFGSPLKLSGGIVGYKTLQENDLLGKDDAEVRVKISQLEKQKSVTKFFSEERVPNSFGTLLFSKDRGLFFFGPIFLLALFGIFSALRGKLGTERGVLLGLVAVNLFLYSSWGDPWGGWAYGTRYLIPSMAVLSLFLASWLAEGKRPLYRRLLAVPLFIYSSAVALLGALTTNAVPPRIEADYLGMRYNFLYNLDFLKAGQSGSFLYNTYLRDFLSLGQYYLLLYGVVLAAFLFVLFILPLFERHDHQPHPQS